MNPQADRLTIRLLIHSGRPDPEWAPGEDVVDKLDSLVQEVTAGQQVDGPPPPVLGYRGFLVQNLGKRASLPDSFTVFRGIFSAHRGAKTQHFQDTARIEQFLLEEARGRDLGETLEALGL